MGYLTMARTEKCSAACCQQPFVSTLNGESVCRSHFILICFTRLDKYKEMQKGQNLSVSDSEEMRRFIHESVRQADEIEHGTRDLDNLDRARLVHIIEEATNLGRYLRRSPRKVASIAVRLCSDKIGGFWEENSETVILSRHGASVQCSRAARPGEILQLTRSDTGEKAQARVAWQRPVEDSSYRIGIEFVDCINFWGLDWAAIEEAH